MNEQTLYVMIGLPASGKSYIAENMAEDKSAIVISSDNIRKEIFGDNKTQDNPNEVFRVAHEEISSYLQLGENVIFDATNISYKHRRTLLQKVKKHNVRCTAIFVATPIEEIFHNNKSRNREVPEYVIKRMLKSIYIPFWHEGWDDILIVWNNRKETDYKTNELIDRLKTFDQENYHHEHTLGEHLLLVADNLKNSGLFDVGLFHDIGKEFTKTFKNMKGDITDVAHYYGHEHVSAYLSLFYLKSDGYSDSDIIDIVTRIQFHMRPYGAKTDRAKKKLKNTVGDDVYKDLIEINRADIDAH